MRNAPQPERLSNADRLARLSQRRTGATPEQPEVTPPAPATPAPAMEPEPEKKAGGRRKRMQATIYADQVIMTQVKKTHNQLKGELLDQDKNLELSEVIEEVLKVGLAHLAEVKSNIWKAKGAQ